MNRLVKQSIKYLNDTQFGKFDIHFREQILLRELASWMINTDSYLITLITGIQVHDRCRFKVCMAWPPLTILDTYYQVLSPVDVLALAYKHFFQYLLIGTIRSHRSLF